MILRVGVAPQLPLQAQQWWEHCRITWLRSRSSWILPIAHSIWTLNLICRSEPAKPDQCRSLCVVKRLSDQREGVYYCTRCWKKTSRDSNRDRVIKMGLRSSNQLELEQVTCPYGRKRNQSQAQSQINLALGRKWKTSAIFSTWKLTHSWYSSSADGSVIERSPALYVYLILKERMM